MFGPKELDTKNTYNPNLNDVQESARRTYGFANSLFRVNELNLKNLGMQLKSGELSSGEDIYDNSHVTVSLLAECCEMYLKALFLYEHRNDGKESKELWTILEAKGNDAKKRKDKNGNVIYYQTTSDKDGNEVPLKYADGTIVYVYAKVDSKGNVINDSDGRPIYVDKTGKAYSYEKKGHAVVTNGHALDRLVDLMSPISRLFLEARMLRIPMNMTEQDNSVSILDLLLERGLISSVEHISQDQFAGWLDQHKRSFEESRFPGQKKYDISVEFMYHLENQIKAVVQYIMYPKKEQQFTVTSEEFSEVPPEIEQLASFHSHLLSQDLIKLIANNSSLKNKFISILSEPYSLPSSEVSQLNFCKMIKLMSEDEIIYISHLWYMVKYYDSFNKKNVDSETFKVATILKSFGMSSDIIIDFFVQLKEILGDNVILENESVQKLFRILRNKMAHSDYDDDNYNKEIKYNFNLEDMNYINNNLKL